MLHDEKQSLINTGQYDLDWKRQVFENACRPLLAEYFGVIVFVFIGCMSIQDGNIVAAAVAHGFTIALLVMATGKISGAHLNPAVTLAIALSGGISPLLAVGYVMVQLLGGVTGAAFVRAVLPLSHYTNPTFLGGAQILPDFMQPYPGQAILVELLLTAILVLVILMAAVDTSTKSDLFPLAIGFTVTIDILAGGNITGASMNPARSFGPAIVYWIFDSQVWQYHYVYWVGPVLGAIVAAFIYRLIFAMPEKRFLFRST